MAGMASPASETKTAIKYCHARVRATADDVSRKNILQCPVQRSRDACTRTTDRLDSDKQNGRGNRAHKHDEAQHIEPLFE